MKEFLSVVSIVADFASILAFFIAAKAYIMIRSHITTTVTNDSGIKQNATGIGNSQSVTGKQ